LAEAIRSVTDMNDDLAVEMVQVENSTNMKVNGLT